MKMRGIKTNFIFNVAGPIVPLVVGLITVPIYVSHIGAARYGLLSITWFLLGYFGFLDLGLSRASANALAKLGDSSLHGERAKVLVTVFWLNLCLGAIGAFIFYLSGSFLIERLLSVPADLKPEIETAFPWVACVLPLAVAAGQATGALESRERFLAANVLQVLGTTAGLMVPVICAVFISPSLSVVIPAAVISRGLSVLLSLGFVVREEWPLSPRNFDRQRCRELLGYGGWISVSNIVGPLLASVDQLVIGSVIGVAAVAHYAVPMSLIVRSQLLAVALSRTLFPRMSRYTPAEAKGLAEKAVITLAYAYGAICAPAVVLAGPFLELWMGKDFGSIARPVAELLFIGAWINGLGFILSALLQGQGRPDIVAKVHALEIIPYIAVLWFLMNRFGLLGAAAAWDLMVTVEAGFRFAAARYHPARLVQLIPPLGFILAAYLFVYISPPGILTAFLAAGVLAAGVGASALIFDTSSREFVASLRFPRRSQRAS
ncbi:MAG: oligosaccharide flippase family protein [Pseudomonadota bacterium]|nr:oligosaccharide flippase family protein [Pseudomonadota bacterium]